MGTRVNAVLSQVLNNLKKRQDKDNDNNKGLSEPVLKIHGPIHWPNYKLQGGT